MAKENNRTDKGKGFSAVENTVQRFKLWRMTGNNCLVSSDSTLDLHTPYVLYVSYMVTKPTIVKGQRGQQTDAMRMYKRKRE